MSTTYTPTQYRSNDPYQQRVLQFSAQDSRVYLSRVSNQLLKGFGNDAVVSGFDLISSTFTGDIFEVVIDEGVLIQDTTLVEVTEQSTLSIDVSGLDDCNSYLLVYTDYKYIESIGLNKFSLKIAHVSNNGLTLITDSSPVSWIEDRNRIYLNVFQFTKGSTNTSLEKTFPTYLYLGGTKYNRRGGQLNFHRTDDVYPITGPFFHSIQHTHSDSDSLKLITQLKSIDGYVYPLTFLQLLSSEISVSIDEYKPFTDPYQLVVSNPVDSNEFTVLSTSISTSGSSIGSYILEHDLNQQYLIAEIYDSEGNLFRPNYINFTDNNNLVIDFNNVINDLSPSYKVILIKNHTYLVDVEIETTDELIEIEHNLGKNHIILQLIDEFDNLYISTNINNSVFNTSDSNNVMLDTSICDLMIGSYKLILYDGYEYVYNLYSTDIYTPFYNMIVRKVKDSNIVSGNLLYIDHNFDNLFPIVGFIEKDLTISNPYEIEVINENRVCLSLASSSSGVSSGSSDSLAAYVYSFDEQSVYSLTSLTSGTSGSSDIYELDISENNFVNCNFQIYNSDQKVIIPINIIQIVEDENYIFEFPNGFDSTDVNIVMIQGIYSDSYSETFETDVSLTPVLINHNLDSYYLFINVFEVTTGEQIYLYNITVVDKDNISITTTNLVPSSEYKVNVITGIQRDTISYSKDNSYYAEFAEDDVDISTSSITITHSLDTICPVIQIYDDDNYQIYPLEIQAVDANSIKITFPENPDLSPYYKVIIIKLH